MTARKLFVVWFFCSFLTSISPVDAEDYEAHEWGTFTTLSNSNGKLLAGLEVEEESLPAFVHDLVTPKNSSGSGVNTVVPNFGPSTTSAGFGLRSKAFWTHVENVTVKMETPVIYFYSENAKPLPVQVNVGFTGGSITQWYPQRSAGETADIQSRDPEHAVDFSGGSQEGSIEWQIDVLPRSESPNFEIVKASDTPTWIHPRLPDANIVASRDHPHEKEKYLFYRGIGNFGLPAEFRQTSDDEIVIDTGTPIPAALIFQKNGNGIRYRWQKNLKKGIHKTTFGEEEEFLPIVEAQAELLTGFQEILIESGLNGKEAESMLLTWWKSYFVEWGTRVFWIVPRDIVDEILPIQFDPAPTNLERVIVGRAELLSPKREQSLLTEFSKEDQSVNPLRYHRYFKAFQEHYGKPSEIAKVAP